MRQEIEARLKELKGEYDKGQTRLRQLEYQLTFLRETMLRISGAVLALEELLSPSALVTSGEQKSLPTGLNAVDQARGGLGLEVLSVNKKEN
jgi:predicted nuclease with TOPRIM domain